MIVKNEAHVIVRCLEKAIPLIDYVWITDTGSTDGTQNVIRDFLSKHQIPGEVVDVPWQDFAHNRSLAMQMLRERNEVDYGLMLDADNYLVFDSKFDPKKFKDSLKADLYDVPVRSGISTHYSPLLFSNRIAYIYKAVLHEYLEVPADIRRAQVTGFLSHQVQDSARNQNPRKYLDDAEVLENALLTETDPFLKIRYTFYLAQSYRDADLHEKAIETYLKRSELGGWNEEIFISLLSVGRLREKLKRPHQDVIGAYLDAYEACPTRAESLHAAAAYCRRTKKYRQAYLFAKEGLTLSLPVRPLFVENWIYHYGLLDEFSIAAYWIGKPKEAFDCCVKLLKNPWVPKSQRARIHQNAQYAIDRLGRPNLKNLLPEVEV